MGSDELELQAELNLALAVRKVWDVGARRVGFYLTERCVARVVVRCVKLRAVEGVEVVHLEGPCKMLTHVKLLDRSKVLEKEAGLPELCVGPYGVAQNPRACRGGECIRWEHLSHWDLAYPVIPRFLIRGRAETD